MSDTYLNTWKNIWSWYETSAWW